MSLKEPDRRELGIYFSLAQVGLEMVAPLGIGVYLDYLLNSSPWALISGTVLGFVGGLTHLIMLAQKQERDQSKKNGS